MGEYDAEFPSAQITTPSKAQQWKRHSEGRLQHPAMSLPIPASSFGFARHHQLHDNTWREPGEYGNGCTATPSTPPFATAVLDEFSELTYIISGGALTDNEVTLLSTLHPLVFSGVSDKSKRGKPHICTVAQTNPAWIQMPWLSYRTSAAPACPLHSVFLASR